MLRRRRRPCPWASCSVAAPAFSTAAVQAGAAACDRGGAFRRECCTEGSERGGIYAAHVARCCTVTQPRLLVHSWPSPDRSWGVLTMVDGVCGSAV